MTDVSWNIAVRVRLDDFRLELDISGAGGIVAIIGPNGAGKSTLLRLLAGGLAPDSGMIQIGGRTLFCSHSTVNVPPERRQVGYMPQGAGLFRALTALANVEFGLSTGDAPLARKERSKRAEGKSSSICKLW